MQVELTKMDFIRLLRGVEPRNYKVINLLCGMGIGEYTGGFEDRFDWKNEDCDCWNKFSERELYDLYLQLAI